jgi:hypothetical protein
MDIITVENEKNILVPIMRRDGETTGKIGRCPLTARNGARARRAGRKGGGRRGKARANTRRGELREHKTQTRRRDFLP